MLIHNFTHKYLGVEIGVSYNMCSACELFFLLTTQTPELQVEVECHLDGKHFNQLSSFIENQVCSYL